MHRAIFPGDNNYDKILAKEFVRIIPYARLNFCVLAFPVSNVFFSSDITAELAMKWLWDLYPWFLSFSNSKYRQSNWEREEMNFKNLNSPQALLWKNKLVAISAMHSQRIKLK